MTRRYTWNRGKLKRAYMEGLVCDERGVLKTCAKDRRFIILDRVNSYEEQSRWGRLKLEAALSPDGVVSVSAFATDAQRQDHQDIAELSAFFKDKTIEPDKKKEYIKEQAHVMTVGATDLLLYELKGQYLWICIEIFGEGSCEISSIVLTEGDNFMQTFPEIYQEEGGFFHRYLSVFSSLYHDLSDEFDRIDTYLDPDTASPKLLSVYAKWLGLEPGKEMLDQEILRSLVKNAYSLNKRKGTLKAVKQLVEIFTGDAAVIMDSYTASLNWGKQYNTEGLCVGPDDVIVISKRKPDNRMHAQLMYFLRQFLPARCRIRILFLPRCSTLGNYGYMNFNAALADRGEAVLNGDAVMGRAALG